MTRMSVIRAMFTFCLAVGLTLSAHAAGKIVLVAGNNDAKSKLIAPFGVDFGPDGTIYVVEMVKGERLRKLSDQRVVTLAGTGKKGNEGDGGPGVSATFNGMHSLAVGDEGKVYLADTWNNRIRVFDPVTGKVAAFAGTGEKGFSGDDGPALEAKFGGVFCIAFDPARKHLFVADLDNRRIRKIDMKTKMVSTVAGNGEKGVPKDGELAIKQPLVDPRAVAADKDGNVYVLERSGHALRVVDKAGKIRTVVGTGKAGAAGVGGAALETQLNGPKHLCIDRDGSVLIADTENHRILWYGPMSGKTSLLAGSGKKGTAGVGGDPANIKMNQPHGVIVHPKTGAIFISDSSNNRVLKLER